jgi:hypothetical protein
MAKIRFTDVLKHFPTLEPDDFRSLETLRRVSPELGAAAEKEMAHRHMGAAAVLKMGAAWLAEQRSSSPPREVRVAAPTVTEESINPRPADWRDGAADRILPDDELVVRPELAPERNRAGGGDDDELDDDDVERVLEIPAPRGG